MNKPEPSSIHLKETKYCDIRHPDILKTVSNIAPKDMPDIEKRLSIFYFVRDKISSGMDVFQITAGDVLKRGIGGCSGKAVLCVTLMRAAGIPCRFAVSDLTRDIFLVIMKNRLTMRAFNHLPETLPHIMPLIWTGSEWARAEVSFDKNIYEACYKEAYDWNIDWDGMTDVIPLKDLCVTPFEFMDDIDGPIDNNFGRYIPPVLMSRVLFGIGNTYVDMLRKKRRPKKVE